MSNGHSKALPPGSAPLSEGDDSGKAGPKRKNLKREMQQMAARLRRDFADEILADPKGFKKGATHYLKGYLPPRAGRPAEASITQAITMRKEGRPWSEVYPQLISGHSAMDAAVRRQAESNLRAAARSRRNAAKRRKRRQRLLAEAKGAPNVPLDGTPRLGAESGA